MKNWKTTVLGILMAGVLLAIAKGWIDKEVGAFIEATLIAVFGIVSEDASSKQSLTDETESIGNPFPKRPR
jgi:hypothetical protein